MKIPRLMCLARELCYKGRVVGPSISGILNVHFEVLFESGAVFSDGEGSPG